jgi:hypothetical protein
MKTGSIPVITREGLAACSYLGCSKQFKLGFNDGGAMRRHVITKHIECLSEEHRRTIVARSVAINGHSFWVSLKQGCITVLARNPKLKFAFDVLEEQVTTAQKAVKDANEKPVAAATTVVRAAPALSEQASIVVTHQKTSSAHKAMCVGIGDDDDRRTFVDLDDLGTTLDTGDDLALLTNDDLALLKHLHPDDLDTGVGARGMKRPKACVDFDSDDDLDQSAFSKKTKLAHSSPLSTVAPVNVAEDTVSFLARLNTSTLVPALPTTGLPFNVVLSMSSPPAAAAASSGDTAMVTSSTMPPPLVAPPTGGVEESADTTHSLASHPTDRSENLSLEHKLFIIRLIEKEPEITPAVLCKCFQESFQEEITKQTIGDWLLSLLQPKTLEKIKNPVNVVSSARSFSAAAAASSPPPLPEVNSTHVVGIRPATNGSKKWTAHIYLSESCRVHLGTFPSRDIAAQVRLRAGVLKGQQRDIDDHALKGQLRADLPGCFQKSQKKKKKRQQPKKAQELLNVYTTRLHVPLMPPLSFCTHFLCVSPFSRCPPPFLLLYTCTPIHSLPLSFFDTLYSCWL